MSIPTNYRWRIIALLFCATTINYIDRQVLAQLKPYLSDDLGVSELQYGYIVSCFQAAYAIGMLVSGSLIDKYGSRLAYCVVISLWSLAGCLHAAAQGFLSLAGARFLLGIGESGNFPTAIKVVAEWFPKKDRAFATGIFNSGSNVGAIVAPPLVTFLAVSFGWRAAFLVTGALGFLWLLFWIWGGRTPEKTKGISPEELKYINSAESPLPQVTIPLFSGDDLSAEETASNGNQNSSPLRGGTRGASALYNRTAIGLALCRLVCDWPWWFFLFWTPDFLKKTYGLDLTATVVPLMAIYIVADIGSIFGGWLSRAIIGGGMTVRRGRALSLLICASLVLPVLAIPSCQTLTPAVAIIALACFAHQAWASNIYTVVSDNFPKEQVGRVTALAGFAGSVGGIFAASAVGYILQFTGSYMLIFAIASCAYLIGWSLLQLLMYKRG